MLYFAFVSVFISIVSLACMVVVVWKTERGLDHSFKFFLGTAVMMLIQNFLNAEKYLGVRSVEPDPYQTLFLFLVAIFFLAGTLLLLMTIVRESHSKD